MAYVNVSLVRVSYYNCLCSIYEVTGNIKYCICNICLTILLPFLKKLLSYVIYQPKQGCCTCQNTRGMIADGKKTYLHRCPPDHTVANVWKFLALFDELLKDEAHVKAKIGKRKNTTYIKFFLILVWIHLGLVLQDLANRFLISKTCGELFSVWITFLCTNWPHWFTSQAKRRWKAPCPEL